MGLEGGTGEVLAGDPIPKAEGEGAANANFFSGEGNAAVIGDGDNLWDPLIIEPETVYVQEESTSNGEPTAPENPSEVESATVLAPEDLFADNSSSAETTTSTTGSQTTTVTVEQPSE